MFVYTYVCVCVYVRARARVCALNAKWSTNNETTYLEFTHAPYTYAIIHIYALTETTNTTHARAYTVTNKVHTYTIRERVSEQSRCKYILI
jgi:hypothetical protein